MKLLVCHRDMGSRRLVARLAPALPGVEFVEWMPGASVPPLEGVDALIAIGTVARETIERGTFGLIQTFGTGYDNVDVRAATECGVWVANMPASKTGNAQSVAEHAILLMLALSRRLAKAQENLRQGLWAQPIGAALCEKSVCLIGLGDVGLALAERLHAFGMSIKAVRRDPSTEHPDYVKVLGIEGLHGAVADSDYIVVCARTNEANWHLVDAALLEQTKPTCILVNIARGSLVDQDALLARLQAGGLAGAGLDVFWDEPVDPAHPLFGLENVIATPHIAGVTDLNMKNSLRLVAANLLRYANLEVPEYVINQPAFRRTAGHTTLDSR